MSTLPVEAGETVTVDGGTLSAGVPAGALAGGAGEAVGRACPLEWLTLGTMSQ